uniref:Set n=1 Tax=Rhizophora mucronata TaxID=61149 RepID=A0A2P2LFY8_RHIMU
MERTSCSSIGLFSSSLFSATFIFFPLSATIFFSLSLPPSLTHSQPQGKKK